MPAKKPAAMFGSGGMVLLDYFGHEERETIYGRVSGAQYKAGTERPLILIDARDLDTMLAMVDKQGVPLFDIHSVGANSEPGTKADSVSVSGVSDGSASGD